MKKQDDSIKKLFDDYASELAPREDLSSAARFEMTAIGKTKPSVSSRPKKSFARHLGWIIPVGLVVTFVVIFSMFLPIFGLGDSTQGGHNAQKPPVSETVYTFADVKGRSVSLSDCDSMLKISNIKQEYQVVSERYYAFYTADGELRYINALLGVRNSEGEFTEILIIAEVDGYVREDLKTVYDRYSKYENLVMNGSYAENGEYVTQAYFAAREMHFYVEARNGRLTDIAYSIIRTLAN